jgi:SpoVK/Ycf46/Vps4 family AAA+-type ATPase
MAEFKDIDDIISATKKWVDSLFGEKGLFGNIDIDLFGDDDNEGDGNDFFSNLFNKEKNTAPKNTDSITPKILWENLPLAEKQEVEDAVLLPIINKDLSRQYGIKPGKGVLLFGPPGCGKTLLMKALAKRLIDNKIQVYLIHLSDILSKWYGSSEQKLKKIFTEALSKPPAYLFIDEFESIGKKRELYNADDVTPRLLSMLLGLLDGMGTSDDVGIIASTNRVEFIDDALLRPGRFDKVIYIPPPDYALRKEIFKIHTALRKTVNIDYEYLAEISHGFSGADIAFSIEETSRIAMRLAVTIGKAEPITTQNIENVLRKLNPSIQEIDLRKYEEMKKRFQRMN